MSTPALLSGASNVQHSYLDNMESARSRSVVGHLWDCIVHWFCQTDASEANLQLYRLFNSALERDKIGAFHKLREIVGAGHRNNFVIGRNEQDGTGRLSIQVDGREVWNLDFNCIVGLHQVVEGVGKEFVEQVKRFNGPDKHAECEQQTDADLTRAAVTIQGETFRYCKMEGEDAEKAKAAHISAVKSALGSCLTEKCLFDAVIRLLSQGSFAPLSRLHLEGRPQGAHGSVKGGLVGYIQGAYDVKRTESGADIVFSQALDNVKHLYVNYNPVPTDPAVSYARSEFTVHLNHQGEITRCSPGKIHSEYRFAEPLQYLEALRAS